MLRPRPAAYPAGQVALYPLSYRCTVHRAGFEPATSRLSVEVTAIFTTDRDGVGGERAMLLLLCELIELRHCSRRDSSPQPPSQQTGTALYRSNSHLHHRQADAFAPAVDGYAGERATSAFRDGTQASFHHRLQRRALKSKAEFAPALPSCEVFDILTTSVGWAAMAAANRVTKILSRRCRRAACCEPSGFALPSVSGSSPRSLRQAPRTWARAFSARAPGSGSPVPADAGLFGWAARRATKNPPERQAREGP